MLRKAPPKEKVLFLESAVSFSWRIAYLGPSEKRNSVQDQQSNQVKTLQENMGHYSAAFTLDRYGHVTEEMRKASSERMQKFIDEMNGKN